MTFTKEEKDGEVILKIKSAISVYEVAAIRDELTACFKSHDRVILDVDEVIDCDTAGVQLILSAFRTAENTGKTFEVRGTSDPVRKSTVDLGLRPSAIGWR
jgi:anti-anti-sigma factor